MTGQFEEIRTARLVLRRLTDADRDAVVSLQCDPRTYEHTPAPTREEAAAKFESWLRDWEDHVFCYLPVCSRESGELVGVGGLQLREFGGEMILNLYYRFKPDEWGKGYATEMATAVIAWADRQMPEHPVQISVNVANQPSLNVAKRLGFLTYVESLHKGRLTRHFRRE